MMRLSSGEAFQVIIDGMEVPLQANNLGMFNMMEDFGSTFCTGKIEYTDSMGILFSFDKFNLKGGESLVVKFIVDGKEYRYDFIITEIPAIVKDVQSDSNMVALGFASPGIKGMISPKYSRGFGKVVSSSVVEEILRKLNFDSYSIDNSKTKFNWIQGYQNNRDFIKFLVSKSVSLYSGRGDFTAYTDFKNKFHFESVSRLFNQSPSIQFSNNPQSTDEIRVSNIAFGNMKELYNPRGGAGVISYYWDEKAQAMKKYEVGLEAGDITDGARNLGYALDESEKVSFIRDEGWTLGRDEKAMKANADSHFLNFAHMGQFVYLSPEGYYPDIHIGQTSLLNYYLSNGAINKGMSGKYLIIGNSVIVTKTSPQTSIKLMRIGYNDGKGRVF